MTPLAVLFLAGSLAMLWFVVLSGETGASPVRQTYFLRADTSGIRGARAVTQWTYLRVCGEGNEGCGPARPALPLGDAWASGAGEAGEDGEDGGRGVPAGLAGEHGGGTTGTHFWYMWRFGWVFYLLALFFETVAFFTGALACLSTRLAATLSGLVALVALVFLTTAVSLMTYVRKKKPEPHHQTSPKSPFLPFLFRLFFPKGNRQLTPTRTHLQGDLRQDAQRLRQRRARRLARRIRLRLQLGRLGGPARQHGALLHGAAQEQRQRRQLGSGEEEERRRPREGRVPLSAIGRAITPTSLRSP